MKTFTPAFKRALNSVAIELGLIETTSSRQEKNGTIAYTDPKLNAIYTLHPNGYIRRTTQTVSNRGKLLRQTYQLNPTRKNNGSDYRIFGIGKTRIMLTPWEQLGKLTSSVISFRNNKKIKA